MYSPYSDQEPGGGRGDSAGESPGASGRGSRPPRPQRSKFKAGDKLVMGFPRTVAEVRATSPNHSSFDDINLADSFTFSTWCLLVPRPIADPNEALTSVSIFLTENREALGDMLPDHVLLVTRTKTGKIDRGFAGQVAKTMELDNEHFPILMFFKEPKVVIRMQYENRALLDLKDDVLNGFAVTLGGADIAAARQFMAKLPTLLRFDRVPIGDLTELVGAVEQDAKARWVKSKAKNLAMPMVKVIGAVGKAVVTGGLI